MAIADQTKSPTLHRDFGAGDPGPLIEAAGVDRVVIVQASPTAPETESILAIAEATDFVAGVVGWVDMESPDAVAQLERLAGQSALRAIRPMPGDPDAGRRLFARRHGPCPPS